MSYLRQSPPAAFSESPIQASDPAPPSTHPHAEGPASLRPSLVINILPIIAQTCPPSLFAGGVVSGGQGFGIRMKVGADRPSDKGAEFLRRHFFLESRIHVVVHRNVQSNRHGHLPQ